MGCFLGNDKIYVSPISKRCTNLNLKGKLNLKGHHNSIQNTEKLNGVPLLKHPQITCQKCVPKRVPKTVCDYIFIAQTSY